ncbi:GILT-like protein 3 [Phlebotomus argentipes]|uniref:GILT-like protein 3 n=1 Tax=Phlebotomus argentipes TaxID=94469 RepID=UPI0028932FF5|nr:GILT-like protein 3 [Phlebotomus argentipes]
MKTAFVLQFLFLITVSYSQKLQLSVYYEALCIDTVNFFRDQLMPTYNEYSDRMDLKLIPYGKAGHYWNQATSKYEFWCQHGAQECHLNKIHACGLYILPFNSAINFTSCLLQYRRTARHHCQPILGNKIRKMNRCMATHADELLAKHGNATAEIGLSFVPTIVPENDSCYARRDSLYRNFRQAFRDEYAAKYQTYPDDTIPDREQKKNIDNLCGPEFPLWMFANRK